MELPFNLNGQIHPSGELHLSPKDGGFLRGEGVFETLITYERRPFLLAEHHARLVEGANRLGILPPNLKDTGKAASELLSALPEEAPDSLRLRITLSSGQKDDSPTLLLTLGELPDHVPSAHLRTSSYTRNPQGALTGIKSTSYAENAVALREARGAGADEALIRSIDGTLSEGSSSNLFAYMSGQWVTPPLESGCLPGVTRALLLRLASDAGIPMVEAELQVSDLADTEECILTSSLREIQPVNQIDGLYLPEAPGLYTRKLQELFAEEKARFLAQ